MLSRGRFAVKVVVLEGPLDNYSLQELIKSNFCTLQGLLLILLLILLLVRDLLLLLLLQSPGLLLREVLALVLVRVTCSGPTYPSYDSLGPSLGRSWAHVRPMPKLAITPHYVVRHPASRSGHGQPTWPRLFLCMASVLLA